MINAKVPQREIDALAFARQLVVYCRDNELVDPLNIGSSVRLLDQGIKPRPS